MKTKSMVFVLLVMLVAVSCNIFVPKNTQVESNFPLTQTFALSLNGDIQRIALSDTWAVAQIPGRLVAIDLNTKEILWELESISSDAESEFVIVDDSLFLASRDEILIIDRLGNIQTINLNPTRKQLIRFATIQHNYIYLIRGGEWTLEVYDIFKDSMIWETWVGRGQLNVFTDAANNIAYVITPRSLRAFDNTNGRLLWEQSRSIKYSVFESNILFSLEKNSDAGLHKLTAINVTTQKELWDSRLATNSTTEAYGLTISDHLVIIYTREGLVAIDKITGSQKWVTVQDDIFYTAPVLFDGILYARGSSQILYAISPNNGGVIGELRLGQKSIIQSAYNAIAGVYHLKDGIAVTLEKVLSIYESK